MKLFVWDKLLVVALLIAATVGKAGATDCDVSLEPRKGILYVEERRLTCLQDPGWFDVGAGIAVIRNAGHQGQNGVGNMVTVRGYPFGRWYATLKTLTPASASLVAAKTAVANAKQIEAADAQRRANEAGASASGNAEKAAADNLRVEADKAATDLALSMQSALNDFGSSYAIYEDSGWAQFYKRIAFFYGRSVGGFDANAAQGDINAFGITFDIAPQVSLAWGKAYYNQLPQNGMANTSASGTVFSIQINLNAFKTMRGLTGSL